MKFDSLKGLSCGLYSYFWVQCIIGLSFFSRCILSYLWLATLTSSQTTFLFGIAFLTSFFHDFLSLSILLFPCGLASNTFFANISSGHPSCLLLLYLLCIFPVAMYNPLFCFWVFVTYFRRESHLYSIHLFQYLFSFEKECRD